MRVELTDRALQVIRQLKPTERNEVLSLIDKASNQDSNRFFRDNAQHKLANPVRKLAYIRGPRNLRLIISFAQDGTVLIEDVLAKEMLSKITGKLIQ